MALDETQVATRDDKRFETHLHCISSDAKYITAIDFMPCLNNGDSRLLNELEQLSPTLFYRGLWLLLPSAVTSVLIIALLCVGFVSVADARAWVVENPILAFICSALFSCIASYGMLVFFTQYRFEQHVERVKLVASNGLIWAAGKGHDLSTRPLVAAKDDAAFSALSK